jgi:uncharacterized protein
MNSLTLSRELAQAFLANKEMALAGASRDPKKFGNRLLNTLKSKGYHMYPINPNTDAIDEDTCYKSIAALPETVKNLLVALPPALAEKTIEQAIAKGISKIWIQQGSESKEAIQKGKDAGIQLITGKCILMYANPDGFHKFHMRINKFFGKY